MLRKNDRYTLHVTSVYALGHENVATILFTFILTFFHFMPVDNMLLVLSAGFLSSRSVH